VSISYTTQTVGTVRSVTFSQTVTNALSSVTQCNLIVLWAVSSGASAQTVQRPTAALPSGFWHHWKQSLTKLYTATGAEIAVRLGVESYFETDNGARIFLWNVCALESTDAAVGLWRFHRTVRSVNTAWIGQVALGKNDIRVFYMHNKLAVNGVWKVLKRGRGDSYLTAINRACCEEGYEIRFPSNEQEIFPVVWHRFSSRVLPKFSSLTSSSWSLLHYIKCGRRVFTYIVYQQWIFLHTLL